MPRLQCPEPWTPSLLQQCWSPPPHPCRDNPGFIPSTGAAFVLPSEKSFIFLQRWNKETVSAASVRQEIKKVVFCSFWRNLSAQLFPWRGEWKSLHGWSHLLLIQSAYFRADVNHTSSFRLYNLQYVKLEIAQELSGNYLIYLELSLSFIQIFSKKWFLAPAFE